ncbi:hypothetical protein PIB30_025643 [Stylosanthes scabra]|uniref:Uncharacterized protein n=1 Tax=Stylosanthes scabra TaxID=79078 RepID=A0ABU6U9L3_9FABA|nr:hypothetical protein [Stylosanthes scabra]
MERSHQKTFGRVPPGARTHGSTWLAERRRVSSAGQRGREPVRSSGSGKDGSDTRVNRFGSWSKHGSTKMDSGQHAGRYRVGYRRGSEHLLILPADRMVENASGREIKPNGDSRVPAARGEDSGDGVGGIVLGID